jgi:hypothetical protein
MKEKVLKSITFDLIEHNCAIKEHCCNLCDIEIICGDSGLDVMPWKSDFGNCAGGYWKIRKDKNELA